MFKKTNQQRLFEDLVAQIEGAILDGRLKAGDKLPPQRDLVKMFQTSRGPLREALRVLEQKGLLDIKRGMRGGAVIRRPGMAPVAQNRAATARIPTMIMALRAASKGVSALLVNSPSSPLSSVPFFDLWL
jgi:DNA-binding FadR family transcriptional regulator